MKVGQVIVESHDLITPRPDSKCCVEEPTSPKNPFLILKLELSLSRSIMLHPFSPNHSPPKNPPARSPL